MAKSKLFLLGALQFACFYLLFSVQALNLQQNSNQISPILKEKLSILRQLSKEAGFPQIELPSDELCLTDGCLDAAFDLLRAINGSVDPCKNFYQYSCGRWNAANPVPPSEAYWDRISFLDRKVSNLTKELLHQEENPNDPKPLNQAKHYFKRCIDLESLEKDGLGGLKTLISENGGWQLLNPSSWNPSNFNYLKAIASILVQTYNFEYFVSQSPIFSSYVRDDYKNSSRQIIYLDQPSFFLPRGALTAPENYTELLSAYETFIFETAKELGSTQTESELRVEARTLINFEISLANISESDEARRDYDRIYNPFSLDQFQAITDEIDESREFTIHWFEFFQELSRLTGADIGENELIIVNEIEYIQKLVPILKKTEIRTLNNYIIWRLVATLIEETTMEMREINFRFQQVLTGAANLQPREDYCADIANKLLGMATGKLYVDTGVFDEEAKNEMNEMVENLLSSFKEMVEEAQWMQEWSKAEAIAKADVFRSFMGYPDWYSNKTAVEEYYEGLGSHEDHLSNHRATIIDQCRTAFQRLNKDTDKERWLMDPIRVNARFSNTQNSITFPAGILQPPFFEKTRPKHQNYGAVGVVIGHEITHGFDDVGSRFNRFGNLENWWDDATKEEYEKRSQCMIDQYDGYFVEKAGLYINGENTLGENIADNGGLRESYRAYQKYVKENGAELRLPGLEHLSPEQLFFIGYANIWCESITPEALVQQILTDNHSPAEFRVIGPVSNSDEFAQVFNCPVDNDGMNPPSENKCIVW